MAAIGTATAPLRAATSPLSFTGNEASWDDLKGIEINEYVTADSYRVEKIFPQRILSGVRGIVLTGFAAPLTPGDSVSELVLSSDLGSCPYCSEQGHSATALVKLSDPMHGLEPYARVTLRGDFTPNFDPETWEAAIIENAQILTYEAPAPLEDSFEFDNSIGDPAQLDLLPPKA